MNWTRDCNCRHATDADCKRYGCSAACVRDHERCIAAMSQCQAKVRDADRVWQPCGAPATETLIVNGTLFEYCTPHVEQFITVLPAGSWEREAL